MSWARSVLPRVRIGFVILMGAVATAEMEGGRRRSADGATEVKRLFLTDFRTLYDCIRKVAFDRSLTVEYAGAGSWLDPGRWSGRGKEEFVVVGDPKKYPFLGEGLRSYVGHLNFSGKGNLLKLRKVRVDLDSGELSGPQAVDLRGLRILTLDITLSLKDHDSGQICKIELSKNYSSREIAVSISDEGEKATHAFFLDFLESLGTKLKLASKLRAARKGT